jgi:hypothetical protein
LARRRTVLTHVQVLERRAEGVDTIGVDQIGYDHAGGDRCDHPAGPAEESATTEIVTVAVLTH